MYFLITLISLFRPNCQSFTLVGGSIARRNGNSVDNIKINDNIYL
jgi:hypothetical protein